MPRFLRVCAIAVAFAAGGAVLTAQLIQQRVRPIRPGSQFPPEIVLDRFIDVTKVAPKLFSVDLENPDARVVRAKLDGSAKVPLHDDRSGVIVAIKDLNLRLTTPDGHSQDLQLKAGETRWVDGDTFREENLSSSPTEFLWIEMLRPKAHSTDTP